MPAVLHRPEGRASELAAVEQIGARHGLTVAVHPHHGTAIERPEHVRRFLEAARSGSASTRGIRWVAAVVEGAAGRVCYAHLNDVDGELAERVASGKSSYGKAARRGLYKPLGEGDVDIGRVLDLLEGMGYEGWYVLEQDVMLETEFGNGPYEDVRKSLAFL